MKKTKKYMPIIILCIVIIAAATASIPLIRWLGVEGNLYIIRDFIRSLGFGGAFVFLLIQMAQIFFAIIPGEPIELVSGMIYGTFGGLLICLTGIILASLIIFLAVRKYGKPFITKFFSEEQLNKYSFFNNSEKLEALIFIMFLIPGTPKDILTYICPLTPIKPLHFILLSTFARIPSVISSTFAGATFSTGNVWGALIIMIITGIIGLAGIICQNKLTEKLHRNKKSK